MNWGEAYFERFIRLFGNPINQSVWQKEGFAPLQILTFAPSTEALTFCSIGLTLFPDRLSGTFEVFVAADDRPGDVPKILGRVLTTLVETSTPLVAGTCFAGIEEFGPGFSAACGKVALYFTNPAGLSQLATVSLENEPPGQILLGFFISAAERDFVAQNGPQRFEEVLASTAVDPAKLNRPSVL